MSHDTSGASIELAHTALARLLAAVGLPAAGAGAPDVSFVGGAAPYPTRVRCAELAAASLAAGAVAAGALHALRTGRAPRVQVDLREAAASLQSYAHLRFEDSAREPAFGRGDSNPAAMGFFPTADGRHVLLHASFPPNHERMLQALGVANDVDEVRAAVARWHAFDLQERLRRHGLTAAVALAPHEWDASEQGRVLAARPVVEVVRVADSAPEPLHTRGPAAHDGVLGGVRVLDLTRVLAGPTCARTLAQYGADVLHIANDALPSAPRFVADTDHGKRNAHLDLKRDDDRAQLLALLREADVFSQGYRAGALERLGLGPLDLLRARPGLVYTSINCFGHEGPLQHLPGWEQLAQTATGLACIQGGAGSPRLLPCALTDYCTGYLAAFGTLVALLRRAQVGGSYLVRVSLCQTGMFARTLPQRGGDAERHHAFTPAELDAWRVRSDGGYGPLWHLRPCVQLSETTVAWQRPAMPLGTSPARW